MKHFLRSLVLIPVFAFSQYGILDDSFGTNGIVINEDNLPDEVNGRWSLAVALDEQKNIYTGTNYNYSPDLTAYNDNILIAKFLPDGQFDTSFAENGYKKINIENGWIYVYDILVSQDNYIYILGGVLDAGNERKIMLVKLDPNGDFVNNFGNNGIALFSAENGASGARMVETAQNEFLIGGNYFREDNSNPGLLIMKINSQGIPVPSFGNNGIIKHNYSNFDVLRDLKLYADGGFQVLDFNSDNLAEYNMILIKFNPDGTLDTSFNQTGYKPVPFPNDNLYDFGSIQLKSNENIIYSANGFDGTYYNMQLTEYLPDGNVNTNFGSNGSVTTYLNNLLPGNFQHIQKTFALTPDDQHIIQVGYTYENAENLAKFALVGFDGNGNYDNQFGTNAVALDKIHPSLNDEPTETVFMGNDRLLVLNGTHLSLACYKIYEGLSVEDLSPGNKFLVVPNPASNSFVISGLKGNQNQIQIFDLTGKLTREFNSVKKDQTINLGAIPKGNYIVKIISNGFIESKKLVVE